MLCNIKYKYAQEKSIENVALAIAFFKDLNGIIKYYIVSVILEDDLIDNLFFCVRLEDQFIRVSF